MLNVNKINSLLCLFEKASSLMLNGTPPTIFDPIVSDCLDQYDVKDILVEITWDDEGLFYEVCLTAQGLSDSIVKNGIITCKDSKGEDVGICLFKTEKLIDSSKQLALESTSKRETPKVIATPAG